MYDGTKKRSANFSKGEIDILVNIIFKYKDIIENEKTDATTWKSKNETWEKITLEFNVILCNFPKDAKANMIQLKKNYVKSVPKLKWKIQRLVMACLTASLYCLMKRRC